MRVFISHIHEESMIASAIKRELELCFGELVEVFLAEGIPLGRNWFDEIKESLTGADIILALFSPYSVDRPWVNIEAGYGVMQGKTMIPICCMGLTPNKLPIVYAIYQGIEISNPDNISNLLVRIASLTSARRMLADLPQATSRWIDELSRVVPQSLAYPPIRPGDSPIVWMIGSHSSLKESEAQKAIAVIDILSECFVAHNFRIVMGTSRMLDYLADKVTYTIEQNNIPGDSLRMTLARSSAIANKQRPSPMPIVLLGSFRSKQGARNIFLDTLGKIPDVAVLIGGNTEGRTPEEYERAREAGIPILPLKFTGGVAALAASTFDESLNADVERVQTYGNRLDMLGDAITDLLERQTKISRAIRNK